MSELPEGSNFFSSLYTTLTREQIVELYRPHGWRIRKCGWREYEIRSEFAELVVEAEQPILMHGPVADVVDNAQRVLEPLKGSNVCYAAEAYDDEMRLLMEWTKAVA
ncbi:MAG: hypothetical protein ACO1SX_20350 [Actinomycetota bacterium]